MRLAKTVDKDGLVEYIIHVGDVFVSRVPVIVRTVLGSCIAVCLFDPDARVGGMNHFMLPEGGKDDAESARYGIAAMDNLLDECLRQGGQRERLEAKVFGGGHVLQTTGTSSTVPDDNIRFALDYLRKGAIRVVSQDIGGFASRFIRFYSDTGQVMLKRMHCTRTRAQCRHCSPSRPGACRGGGPAAGTRGTQQ